MRQLYALCRGFAAFMIMFYGFAKSNGSQFTVLDSVLDQRLEDVSGYWLTWYYFGYSQAYGLIIAFVQISAGTMLLFRRTTLLGALVLFGAMGNIILINLFFDIASSALNTALVIEASLGIILWQNRSSLISTFWNGERQGVGVEGIDCPVSIKWLTRASIVVVPALFTYWVANYNNRHPTSIDGSWQVEVISSPQEPEQLPERIYFEYNRAFMSVFAYADSSSTHHFTVNENDGSLDIWKGWLKKERLLFSGDFKWAEGDLVLEGHLNQDRVSTQLKLKRLRPGP